MAIFNHISEENVTAFDLEKHDAVIFNKHSSKYAVNIMKICSTVKVLTIYDIDDWILDLPEYSVTELLEDQISNIVYMIRNASFVTTSSEPLLAKLLGIRKDAIILKNGIDVSSIRSGGPGSIESKTPKILFSNTDGIKLTKFKSEFIEVLAKFLRNNPEFSIDYWGDIFPEVFSIPRVRLRGFLENSAYKKELLKEGYWFSIVPLGGIEEPESLYFNSCKSCIKYIDYGAIGIPGIYSRTPVYQSAIRDMETGLLVDNGSDYWGAALDEMSRNTLLRKKIRDESYIDVASNYGLEKSAKILFDLISHNLN